MKLSENADRSSIGERHPGTSRSFVLGAFVPRDDGFAPDTNRQSGGQQVLMAMVDKIAEPLMAEPKLSGSLSNPATSRLESIGDYSMLKLDD
jgi:hypothetical protein